MQVDVVIVTYRSAEHLPACLAALPNDVEVIVVDNDSGDDAPALAEAAGATVVRNTDNRGFAAAANQGARVGSGDAVLFLNPDAVVDAANLQALVVALADAPAVAAVGPRLVSPEGVEQRAWWPFPSPAATWVEALGLHRLLARRRRADARGFVVGACLLVRRDAFDAAGGFDERYWLYGEETDLCRRFWDEGWQVRLVESALAFHIGGASGETVSEVTFEHFQRGAEHFIAKHHGRWGLLGHRTGLLVGSLVRLPWLAVHDRRRAAHRWAIARRLLWRLAASPFAVPIDRRTRGLAPGGAGR